MITVLCFKDKICLKYHINRYRNIFYNKISTYININILLFETFVEDTKYATKKLIDDYFSTLKEKIGCYSNLDGKI